MHPTVINHTNRNGVTKTLSIGINMSTTRRSSRLSSSLPSSQSDWNDETLKVDMESPDHCSSRTSLSSAIPTECVEGNDDEKRNKIAAQVARRQASTMKLVLLFCSLLALLLTSTDEECQQGFLWILSHVRSIPDERNLQRRLLFANSNNGLFPKVVYLQANEKYIKVDPRVSFFFPERSHVANPRRRKSKVTPMITKKSVSEIADSGEYDEGSADPLETEDCRAQYSWQIESKPNCNTIHEIDLTMIASDKSLSMEFIDEGYWRDVWMIEQAIYDGSEESAAIVLKTQRYMHDFVERNLDRNRRDAVAMEHLTASPWILNVYGFCATSGFYEFASEGSIADQIWPSSSTEQQSEPDLNDITLDFLRFGRSSYSV